MRACVAYPTFSRGRARSAVDTVSPIMVRSSRGKTCKGAQRWGAKVGWRAATASQHAPCTTQCVCEILLHPWPWQSNTCLFEQREETPKKRSTCAREVEDPPTTRSYCITAMKGSIVLREPLSLLTPQESRTTWILLASIWRVQTRWGVLAQLGVWNWVCR